MNELLTYEDYSRKGYSRVPEEQFARFSSWAVAYAKRHTFGRIFRPWPEEFEDLDPIWQQNLIGLCELVDLHWARINQEDKIITGFSNSKYSESYATVEPSRIMTSDDSMREVMNLFFTQDQLSRQVIPTRRIEE